MARRAGRARCGAGFGDFRAGAAADLAPAREAAGRAVRARACRRDAVAGMAGGGGGAGGELAGLPELHELFQAGEDAGEAGQDEGVEGGRDPGALLPGLHGRVQVGDLGAEGGWGY